MARDAHGALRELLCDDIQIHLAGLNAPVLHLHNSSLLGKIPQTPETELFLGMVLLACPYWHQYRVCDQRQMGWAVLYGSGRALYGRGSVE